MLKNRVDVELLEVANIRRIKKVIILWNLLSYCKSADFNNCLKREEDQ